jgi:hypothetical protein
VRPADEKERVMVKLVPILQCRAVDLGCHATGVEKRPGIYGQSFAAIQNFVRCFAGRRTLAAKRVEAQVMFGAADALVSAGTPGGVPY